MSAYRHTTVRTAEMSRSWTTRRDEKRRRMQLVQSQMQGPILPRERLIEALEALIVSGDRVVLEGDNQKQADFLSRSLVKVDAGKVHDLHLVISSISRPECQDVVQTWGQTGRRM
jgi:malonate decarboxylase alpha subunit